MSFGPTMVNDVIHTPELAGSRLMLHDVNEQRLLRAYRFAAKLNAGDGGPGRPRPHHRPRRGARRRRLLLSSAEFGRFRYWRQDYEIPNRYGARQINGENGGPGCGVPLAAQHQEHAGHLRRHREVLPRRVPDQPVEPDEPGDAGDQPGHAGPQRRHVPRDADRHHPARPAAAHAPGRTSRPRRRASTTSRSSPRSATAAPARTSCPGSGELFAKQGLRLPARARCRLPRRPSSASARSACLADELYAPLVAHMVREYGIVPCSVDSHIGEYLPFALDVGRLPPRHVDCIERIDAVRRTARHVGGRHQGAAARCTGSATASRRSCRSSPRCGPATPTRIMAVNVPNRGYMPDVADGAIVEVGATVDGDGIHPDAMPPIGEPIAGYIATQVALQDLIVEAGAHRRPGPGAPGRDRGPAARRPTRTPAGRCSTSSASSRPTCCHSDLTGLVEP